jgi:hypothetical protein
MSGLIVQKHDLVASESSEDDFEKTKHNKCALSFEIIVIYATSFCVNWAFLIARGTRLKHERSEGN